MKKKGLIRCKRWKAFSKILVLLSVVVTLISCTYSTPVTVYLAEPRMDPPTLGATYKDPVLGVSLQQTDAMILIPDALEQLPDLSSPREFKRAPLKASLYLSLPIQERMEVSVDALNGLQLRLRILGPLKQHLRQGAVSMAGAVGVNYRSSQGTRGAIRFGAPDEAADWQWDTGSWYTHLMAGVQVSRNLCVYGGPFYASYDLSGKLKQEFILYDDSVFRSYSLNSGGTRSGMLFGAELVLNDDLANQAFRYTLQSSQLEWNEQPGQKILTQSLTISYHF